MYKCFCILKAVAVVARNNYEDSKLASNNNIVEKSKRGNITENINKTCYNNNTLQNLFHSNSSFNTDDDPSKYVTIEF